MTAVRKGRSKSGASAAAETARKQPRRAQPHFPLTVSRPELLVDGSDRDFRHLVHGLFGFLSRHERIRAGHGRAIGLGGVEYTTLISIAHLSAEGDVSVKRVAEHLHVSGAFITSTVQRLVERGIVHKETDSGDRRRVTLSVSARGNALIEGLADMQRQVNDVEFGSLSREEFRILIGLIDRLIESGKRAVTLQDYLLANKETARAIASAKTEVKAARTSAVRIPRTKPRSKETAHARKQGA